MIVGELTMHSIGNTNGMVNQGMMMPHTLEARASGLPAHARLPGCKVSMLLLDLVNQNGKEGGQSGQMLMSPHPAQRDAADNILVE